MVGSETEVSESGKGEGNSSSERESGLVIGSRGVDVPKLDVAVVEDARPFCGVGGGDALSLFRSFRVMCGRDWESSDASSMALEVF